MKRRQFIKIIGSAIVARPLPARAQAGSPPLVGVLSPISADTAKRNIQAFRSGLRALGYREGQNIRIELRFGDGAIERLPALAAELVRLKPAVIVAGSPPAALAVRDATHTIPIVMNSSENPLALGLASSLARPGGNVTGFWWGDEGLIGKQLELLKEAKPDTRSAGIIVDPDDRNSTEPLKLLPTVTRALDLSSRAHWNGQGSARTIRSAPTIRGLAPQVFARGIRNMATAPGQYRPRPTADGGRANRAWHPHAYRPTCQPVLIRSGPGRKLPGGCAHGLREMTGAPHPGIKAAGLIIQAERLVSPPGPKRLTRVAMLATLLALQHRKSPQDTEFQ